MHDGEALPDGQRGLRLRVAHGGRNEQAREPTAGGGTRRPNRAAVSHASPARRARRFDGYASRIVACGGAE